ncbi:hypothetical protein JCM9279_000551 [Rhodotorula babjevae]
MVHGPHIAKRRHGDPPDGTSRIVHGSRFNIAAASKGPKHLAAKNHFVAMVGEYVGTCLFMIFALGGTNVANVPATSITGGTQAGQDGTAASTPNTSNLLYIALSFGFSLAVCAWIFFRVSGGLFNPAVSLGMFLVGVLTPMRAVLLTISQILGGITGSAIIQALLPGTLNVRTTLIPGMSVVRGLFLEMFLTAMLMITILLLAAEKTKATFLAPIGIGLALFIAELLGVYYTGGSLNPARSFGPSVVLHDFESYHWIYWLGPAMGATLAAGFYKFIKWLEFETVLGPEDAENQPSAQKAQAAAAAGLAAPPTTMMGLDSTTAAPGREKPSSSSATPARPREDVKPGATAKAQGPGIPDLLTKGSSTAVLALSGSRLGEYKHRLDRIEQLVNVLVGRSAERRAPSSGRTVVSVPSTPYFETSADPVESIDGGESVIGGGVRRESDRSPV